MDKKLILNHLDFKYPEKHIKMYFFFFFYEKNCEMCKIWVKH